MPAFFPRRKALALPVMLVLLGLSTAAWPVRSAHAAQPGQPDPAGQPDTADRPDLADRPDRAVRLPACPGRPNCVITQAEGAVRDGQYIDPLPFTGEAGHAMRRLAVALAAQPGCTVVDKDGLTLRAECRSKVFGFIDDVVCTADPEASVVHLRSAARTGWWDFGVNRDRAEQLRRKFLGLTR
ncbi:DUF1499 domain-containing protein [Nitratidesulfovibrio sp. HK-II]|uniref:DUF1499 domain-containing protein n=1 Tax=Nitratidesulfovibrio sp. HK-II TaxID=2009266 RepID=UPI000E2FB0AA|nr:DUF1499 domain-containing protein [Nitratidesulfovibrio sp. HK-II]GBO95308.1 hypothetical protein RVX_0349 [Nitratidesulfovibrio sp. HK-II]